MVNYSKMKEEKSLKRRINPLLITKEKYCLVFLFFLVLLPAILTDPAHAFGKDKVAVLPFKVDSTIPPGNLDKSLQEMFSKQMDKLGYQVVSTQLINSVLGDNISYADPEKEIIPFGKANNADWIIMGEVTEKEGSIQLNVKVLDPGSAKTPFSVMMIENDRKNLPEAIKKIAESLSNQVKNNVIIADIIVKGSKRASEDAILNIIESQKGDQYDPEKLDRDLRTIYKMGFFEDANYDVTDSPSGKIITFNLVEKPTIIGITFEGNKYKKTDKLMEELGINKYSVLNRSEVRQSRNRLLEYYKKNGYYNVEINPQVKVLEDENEVILNYVIKEGEKVYIKKIQFKGNKVFDDDDLRDIMLTKEKGWLSWFTDSGLLEKKKLEFDLNRLGVYYDNAGYVRSTIGEPEITYDKKEEGLILTIPVSEGDQYKVNDVVVKGDLLIPADKLRKLLDIKKGEPFSRQVLYTEIDNIKGLYADMGYAYAEAIPSWDIIEGTNLVDITVTVQKNKRVQIERINIYGNEITKDKVLRRELKIAEGDYYNRDKIERSKENMYRLDLFENQEIKERKGSNDDKMILDIEGEESLRRSVTFSAGYGGYEKFMFQANYANNNMFGRGQVLELDALFGGTTTRFNVSYKEPWLFDKPVRGTVNLYDWDRDYDDYTRKQLGGGVGIAFLLGLDDYTRGSISYTYDKSKLTDVYTTSEYILAQKGEYVTSSTTLGVERNSMDRMWDTSKGSLNYLTYEYAGGIIGGDVAFNKYLFGSTLYLPVMWKTVFVISTELGYVRSRSGGTLPLYEKFREGGIDSVRGYEWGSISPLDPKTYDELGGNMKWLYKLEYRVPIKRDQGMSAIMFFDTGNAFNKDQSWKKGAGMSVGFGLRWRSPMGYLRLEYGYKLKDNVNDTDSGRFEFKIGGAY